MTAAPLLCFVFCSRHVRGAVWLLSFKRSFQTEKGVPTPYYRRTRFALCAVFVDCVSLLLHCRRLYLVRCVWCGPSKFLSSRARRSSSPTPSGLVSPTLSTRKLPTCTTTSVWITAREYSTEIAGASNHDPRRW